MGLKELFKKYASMMEIPEDELHREGYFKIVSPDGRITLKKQEFLEFSERNLKQ